MKEFCTPFCVSILISMKVNKLLHKSIWQPMSWKGWSEATFSTSSHVPYPLKYLNVAEIFLFNEWILAMQNKSKTSFVLVGFLICLGLLLAIPIASIIIGKLQLDMLDFQGIAVVCMKYWNTLCLYSCKAYL